MPSKPVVAVVLGTRPEAIKLAPVIHGLRQSHRLACRVYSTGQHLELLDQTMASLGIAPDDALNLMRPNQALGDFTSDAVRELARRFAHDRPAMTVVQGDTTTAMAAALASFYAGVPVAHVEAGLRTGDSRSPFPEEANRRIISVLADLHFAPTEGARRHLLAENTPDDRILVTGNTSIDSVLQLRARFERGEVAPPVVPGRRAGHRLVLITGHRRESFGDGLRDVCLAIGDLALDFPDVDFVYPVHPNPNVQEPVHSVLHAASYPNVLLTAPMDYVGFVAMMAQAVLVITDSGGVQEEAPSLRTPVLVTRAKTERPEALAGGSSQLVGTDRQTIRGAATAVLRGEVPAASDVNPFGDGRAAERIVARLERELLSRNAR
ncbi:MAG: UDP-N-acetylglucosamine 2-epimerase (non-hydrolyzing) [Gemmatimonadota bacterium]|nr:UDP-N-acetylglucosamine 2-epimerase (non-hydrolyzing) [Gemmatimonadota bacterium]